VELEEVLKIEMEAEKNFRRIIRRKLPKLKNLSNTNNLRVGLGGSPDEFSQVSCPNDFSKGLSCVAC
jgi:hypothetical protein